MEYIVGFVAGVIGHLIISNYAINKSVGRKVLFWKKRAYYVRDIGEGKISNMPNLINKVESLEKKDF